MIALPDNGKWLHEQVLDTETLSTVLLALSDAQRHEGTQLMLRDFTLRRQQLLEQLATLQPTDAGQIGRIQGGISAYDEILGFYSDTIKLMTPPDPNEETEQL